MFILNPNKLSEAPYFTLKSLSALMKNKPLPSIKYWLKTQKITGLKRGVYVANSYLEKITWQGKINGYKEHIANYLMAPSYLSLEYALSLYSLLTEAPQAITSATLKTPRSFINNLGGFYYYHLKPNLFLGYNLVEKNGFSVHIASKAKALFDYLYLRKRIWKTVNLAVVEELRLNLMELTDNDWNELEKYVRLAESKKLLQIYALLFSLKNR